MTFCVRRLLKERISKMTLIRAQVITQQATKDNHTRRPSATAPEVAPVKILWSLLVTSPAARDKVFEYADGSLITKTTAKPPPLSVGDLSTATSATPWSWRDCVPSKKGDCDELGTQFPEHIYWTSETSCFDACDHRW